MGCSLYTYIFLRRNTISNGGISLKYEFIYFEFKIDFIY